MTQTTSKPSRKTVKVGEFQRAVTTLTYQTGQAEVDMPVARNAASEEQGRKWCIRVDNPGYGPNRFGLTVGGTVKGLQRDIGDPIICATHSLGDPLWETLDRELSALGVTRDGDTWSHADHSRPLRSCRVVYDGRIILEEQCGMQTTQLVFVAPESAARIAWALADDDGNL